MPGESISREEWRSGRWGDDRKGAVSEEERELGVPEAKGSAFQEEGRSSLSNQLRGQSVFNVIRSLGLSFQRLFKFWLLVGIRRILERGFYNSK